MDITQEHVILVDENDRQIGTCEKLEAHQKGLLHRAFSVFLFNSKGELLIHQRADQKYHTGGLWSNTCCSHPAPDEPIEEGIRRKLIQEMGINTPVKKMFEFSYSAKFDNGLTENELDYVYFGEYNEAPNPNPEEVQAWKYSSFEEIKKEVRNDESRFTPWFKMLLKKVEEHYYKTTGRG